jgi:streptogramin lyase
MFDLASRPSGILAAGDVIWAEDHAQTNRVYAIDPETGKTLAAINVTRPCDLAATPGSVWVADLDGDRLIRIDVTTRKADGEVPGLRGPCGPQVSAGVIWLAVDDGLARVDPKTGKVATTKLGGGAFPGAGEPLWAAKYESGELLRVDPKTGEVKRTIPPPGGAVEGPPVAVGFQALWFGNGSNRRVYRLDPVSGAVKAEIATSMPARLMVTAESVWLTSYNEGVVERIDPATDTVVYRARLGGNINGITEGFGSVWVSDTGRGRLYRLDPAATGVEP